jgi:hypothetical protein
MGSQSHIQSSADIQIPYWKDLKARVASSFDYGPSYETLDSIAEGIMSGKLQWWTEGRSCVVTILADYPTGRVVHVKQGGGALSEMKILAGRVLAWGRSRGAVRCEVAGRKGWARLFGGRVVSAVSIVELD